MKRLGFFALCGLALHLPYSEALAAPVKKPKYQLCLKGAEMFSRPKCRKNETRITPANALSLFGYTEPVIPQEVRPYGNGSAGPLTISGNVNLSAYSNFQFTDITIASGALLTVPSGTTLRCTGTMNIMGTVYVDFPTEARSVSIAGTASSIAMAGMPQISAGIGHGSAGFGSAGDNTASRAGGKGGIGLQNAAEARQLLRPGNVGGGTGAGARTSSTVSGGGTLTVLCKTGITIASSGSILADGALGASGAGGGGGGVVILASSGAINHAGLISATGGDGSYHPSDSNQGPGGGGGGGVVQMLAPSIVDVGTTNVDGGSGGPALSAGTITATIRHGGGGGGPSGGNGGDGGSANTNGSSSASSAGSDGYFLKSLQDPAGLF